MISTAHQGWFRPAVLVPVALVAAIGFVVLAWFQPQEALGGYLAALLLYSGIPLGGLGLLMLHLLTGGVWGRGLRNVLELMASTLPLVGLLLIPVVILAGLLYPWASGREALEPGSFRGWYLQPWFVVGRAIGFYVLGTLGAWAVVALSQRQRLDRDASAAPRSVAAIGVILYFVCASFAGADWIIALTEHFYSSMVGFYVVIGQCLTAIATVTLLVVWRPAVFRRRELPEQQQLHDLGNLLLALVVLHAYIAFSQYFIIWNGDLPHTVHWYVPRSSRGWVFVSLMIMFGHFFVPFVALLFKAVKLRPWALATVAGWVLVMRVFDNLWMVVPSLEPPYWPGVVGMLLAIVVFDISVFLLIAGLATRTRFLPAARLAGEAA